MSPCTCRLTDSSEAWRQNGGCEKKKLKFPGHQINKIHPARFNPGPTKVLQTDIYDDRLMTRYLFTACAGRHTLQRWTLGRSDFNIVFFCSLVLLFLLYSLYLRHCRQKGDPLSEEAHGHLSLTGRGKKKRTEVKRPRPRLQKYTRKPGLYSFPPGYRRFFPSHFPTPRMS